jgi:hypothetical protein
VAASQDAGIAAECFQLRDGIVHAARP